MSQSLILKRQDKDMSNKPTRFLKNLIHYSWLFSALLDKSDNAENSLSTVTTTNKGRLKFLISTMVIYMPRKQNDPL